MQRRGRKAAGHRGEAKSTRYAARDGCEESYKGEGSEWSGRKDPKLTVLTKKVSQT